MQNSANTKPLDLELLTEPTWFIFTLWFEKCFEVTETIQKLMPEGNWDKLPLKRFLLR